MAARVAEFARGLLEGYFPEGEGPGPRLWPGYFNSPWSVPPQWLYRSSSLLRGGFSSIKSKLNGCSLCTGWSSIGIVASDCRRWIRTACPRAWLRPLCEHVPRHMYTSL